MEKKNTFTKVMQEKSQESGEAGNILAQEGKYNSAVNRYYYSIYQLIMSYIGEIKRDRMWKYLKKEGKEGKTRKYDSHEITIRYFVEKFNKELSVDDILYLKRGRHAADYKTEYFTETKYSKFEKIYNDTRDTLKR